MMNTVPTTGSAKANLASSPRLLGLKQAAAYLGISIWAVRDLIANHTLHPVQLPLAGRKRLRRVLLDIRDLEKLVEQSKAAA